MGMCIAIEKKYVESNIYFYLISNSVPRGEFYMAIDPLGNRVLFFVSNDLKNPVTIVDFDLQEEVINIPGEIDTVTALRSLSKAYYALVKNDFPNRLDYCS